MAFLVFLLGNIALAGAHADARDLMRSEPVFSGLLLDGAVAGPRLVVVGERGHVLISSDDGETWKQARVPTRSLLTAVHMHDERTGWAVGHDAIILRTIDGGMSWTVSHRAPEEELPLLDVWFRDGKTGFAVGAYGHFLFTRDGGETWMPRVISGNDFHLNALIPVAGAGHDSQRLYIAAEAGTIYRSDDGGENWKELPSPYGGSWFGGLAPDGNRVLLVGLRGHLFRSENGGDHWIEVDTGTQSTLTGAFSLSEDLMVFAGLGGILLTSRDGGRSVSSRRLASREGISAVLPLADGDMLLVGEFGIRRWGQDE